MLLRIGKIALWIFIIHGSPLYKFLIESLSTPPWHPGMHSQAAILDGISTIKKREFDPAFIQYDNYSIRKSLGQDYQKQSLQQVHFSRQQCQRLQWPPLLSGYQAISLHEDG